MGNFCEYCGRKLVSGEVCDCPEAIEERGEPVHIPVTYCDYCGARLEGGAVCSCPEAVLSRGGESPEAPQIRTEPLRDVADASKKIAVDIGREAKSSWKDVVSNPTDMAANHSFSKQLSIVILVLDALIKIWFVERIARAFLNGAFEAVAEKMGSGYTAEEGDAALAVVNAIEIFTRENYSHIGVIMAAQTAFFVALVYFLPKVLKNSELHVSIDSALSTAAFASIPWMAAGLITSGLLSALSFSSLSVYASYGVCGIALVCSVSLLDAGMKKYIPDDKRRMTLMAVSYGIQIALVMYALLSFVPELLVNGLYDAIYS